MMIKVDDSVFDRGVKAIKRSLGNNIRSKRTAVLGSPIHNKAVYADTEQSLVYVHGLGAEPGAIETIPASGISKELLIYGQPILLEQNDNGQWVFYNVDTQADAQFRAGITAEHDQTPISLSQLDYGTIHPQTGLVLLVKAAMYDDTWVDNLLTGDFSTGTVQDTSAANITIPTTNNKAKIVLIQVDPAAGTLSYKQSSEFSATLSPEAAKINGLVPATDSSKYRVGVAKLIKGITQFDYSHVRSWPEFLSKGDATWPITVSSALTIASNTQRVVGSFTVDTGGSVTIDGRLIIV